MGDSGRGRNRAGGIQAEEETTSRSAIVPPGLAHSFCFPFPGATLRFLADQSQSPLAGLVLRDSGKARRLDLMVATGLLRD